MITSWLFDECLPIDDEIDDYCHHQNMPLPPEIFTIISKYLYLRDISSLVLISNEVHKWVNMNDIIREYYLAIKYGENNLVVSACRLGYVDLLIYLHRIGTIIPNRSIIWAINDGHLPVVKYLHSIGADPTAEDNDPIRQASKYGHLPVVEYLHLVGADLMAEDNLPIRQASKYGHLSVVEYLLTHGAVM